MSKSYTAMEKKICIVCAQTYDTGAILLDKRLQESLENPTISGTGICPEHTKMHENGYIALVEIDPTKSKVPAKNNIKQEDAYRTGTVAHIRREVAKEMFDISEEVLEGVMLFTEKAVLDKISEQMPADTEPS